MIDITGKNTTLRKARARAIVRTSSAETVQCVVENKVPKGNVLEMAKAAALFGVKRTSDVIPDCHPMPIEFTSVKFITENDSIVVEVDVRAIYKTGVEVEAMYGASVAALTIYDMLKPIDKNIAIESIKLLEKSGGKSDFRKKETTNLSAAVIVCSDSVSAGKKEDKAGKAIIEKLKSCAVEIAEYAIIPDEPSKISEKMLEYSKRNINIIIFTGGTGLSPRDATTETLLTLINKRIPGIEETLRNYGQQRTPYSMLSRSVAGLIDNSLVLGLPGSTRGAEESMEAIFPEVLHIFKVMRGARHE